ncbi:MAG: HEAT repeat domain-containing protein [Planctomycetes bacterium]|nr:HEAT repeat domain-containing protein [Planctomycetota bacterium]
MLERGLLSDPKLARHYDAVVWMYLFQDFTHSETDRAAERVAIRFGITAWPQHFLVDPFTLGKLADTGRSLGTFGAAVAKAVVKPGEAAPSVAELAALDELAKSLEGEGDVAVAKRHLKHADRVVAFRALEIVAKKAPAELVPESGWLLAVPNDQIRGIVCDVLAEHGDGRARESLHAIVRDPEPSENPNALRVRAVKALARCGDGSSLPVIAPFATSGAHNNSLTGVSVRAVAAIAARLPESKAAAVAVLVQAYPPPPKDGEGAPQKRMCEALVKEVHKALGGLTGKQVPLPADYTEAARQELSKIW